MRMSKKASMEMATKEILKLMNMTETREMWKTKEKKEEKSTKRRMTCRTKRGGESMP